MLSRIRIAPPSTRVLHSAKKKALEKFFFETLGLQSRLSDLGIDDKNFALMAKKACGAKGKLVGSATLSPADVEEIFRMSL